MASCGSGGLVEWNGVTWTAIAPGPGTPWLALADAECVYDAARNELVQLAWGTTGCTTARWNGVAWTVSTQATAGPASRSEHNVVYDPPSQRVLLFGGKAGTGAGTVMFDDLWQWNGSAWTPSPLTTRPGPRSRAAFVFDEARQQMVAFSGDRQISAFGSVPCSDTWAYDGRPAHGVQSIGAGCHGAHGPLPLVAGVPHPGAASFAVEAHVGAANAPCLIAFSFASGAVALGSGCTQWLAGLDVAMFAASDGTGVATVTGAVPLAWYGVTWFAQAAVLDPTLALGVALSDGVRLTGGY